MRSCWMRLYSSFSNLSWCSLCLLMRCYSRNLWSNSSFPNFPQTYLQLPMQYCCRWLPTRLSWLPRRRLQLQMWYSKIRLHEYSIPNLPPWDLWLPMQCCPRWLPSKNSSLPRGILWMRLRYKSRRLPRRFPNIPPWDLRLSVQHFSRWLHYRLPTLWSRYLQLSLFGC